MDTQFAIVAMNRSVYTVLSPILIINYIFGLKIIQLPIGHLREWFGILYILLLWLIYYFLLVQNILIRHLHRFSTILLIFNALIVFKTLLSSVIGVYHDKKFRNCLKRLAIVDATLEKLGIITNYKQLHGKTVWIVLGWFITSILLNSLQVIFLIKVYQYDGITTIYLVFILNHWTHVNFLGDLTMTNIIGYVGTKFTQINEHLKNMPRNNKYEITLSWDNTMPHMLQRQFAKASYNKWIIWIIIQLHLELRKISREIDSIYGIEMTFNMGCYFLFIATGFNSIFHVIFIHNYTNHIVLYTTISLSWCLLNILKFFIINLVYEKVSNQANSTTNFLGKILYSMKDVEICDNISQLLLHIKQSPLKFNGIGLFQFGQKFIYGFVASVGTLLVILIQAHTQSKNMFKNID